MIHFVVLPFTTEVKLRPELHDKIALNEYQRWYEEGSVYRRFYKINANNDYWK